MTEDSVRPGGKCRPGRNEIPVAPDAELPERDPLAKRFLNFRTLFSFVIGLAILGFVLCRVDVNVNEIRAKLAQTNLPLFLAALLLYYATFPIRALALAAAAQERRLYGSGRTDGGTHLPSVIGPRRDRAALLVRQLHRAGQARRCLPGLPAQERRRRLVLQDVRHDPGRAHHRHAAAVLAAGRLGAGRVLGHAARPRS